MTKAKAADARQSLFDKFAELDVKTLMVVEVRREILWLIYPFIYSGVYCKLKPKREVLF